MSRNRRFPRIGSMFFCVALLFGAAVQGQGTVLEVPAQFSTIQGAIQSASSGDVVRVQPGTYVESIDFLGKEIVVASTAGAAATIIDASYSDTVCRFVNGEGPGAVLEGFTLTGGYGLPPSFLPGSTFTSPDGTAGGIECIGASPTIRHCRIVENTGGLPFLNLETATMGPGGVRIIDGSPTLIHCMIEENSGGYADDFSGNPYGQAGGWIGGYPWYPAFLGIAPQRGAGGVYALRSSALFSNCTIRRNHASQPSIFPTVGAPGGIMVSAVPFDHPVNSPLPQFSEPFRLENCTVSENVGTGGRSQSHSHMMVVGATYSLGALLDVGSDFSGSAGGIDASAPMVVENSMIVENVVTNGTIGGVGGIRLRAIPRTDGGINPMSMALRNVTVAGNFGYLGWDSTTTGAGGILIDDLGLDVEISGSIVWGNRAVEGESAIVVEPVTQYGNFPATVTAHHCVIEGGFSGVSIFDVDPEFASPNTADETLLEAGAGDYRLRVVSPCIDRGETVAASSNDFEEGPRMTGGAVDIGADEIDAASSLLIGSREDFELRSVAAFLENHPPMPIVADILNGVQVVDAAATTFIGKPEQLRKSVPTGVALWFQLVSPDRSFVDGIPFVAMEVPTTTTPTQIAGFPEIKIDPSTSLIIFDGWAGPEAPMTLGESGIYVSIVVPTSAPSGLLLRAQGFVISPLAANAIFAAGNGHEFTIE